MQWHLSASASLVGGGCGSLFTSPPHVAHTYLYVCVYVPSAGHFGSGVVSYFVFLRWLFLVNLLCAIIWTSFVSVPQYVWRATPEGQAAFEQSRRSRLTCLLDPDVYPVHAALSCPNNETVHLSSLCQETNVTSFNVSVCEDASVVWRSSPSHVVVSDLAACNLTQDNGSFVLCRNVQPPDTFPLQYIVDFITGQGIFNVTVLFIGQYFNGFVGGVYDLPTAVLLTTGVVYFVFILLIIARWVGPLSTALIKELSIHTLPLPRPSYRMSLAFSPTNFRRKRGRVDYCNKVFSAWDCNITDAKSARLKRAGIKTELEVWSQAAVCTCCVSHCTASLSVPLLSLGSNQ